MNTIKQNVMASVRLIYWGRKAMSATALKAYGLVLGLVALRELTYLRQAIANMFDVTSVDGFVTFVSAALMNTELTVQAALAVTGVLAALLLRDALRRPRLRTATL